MSKQPDCCICGDPCEPWHEGSTGYGHNPWPFDQADDDRCCSACNDTKVIPARLGMVIRGPGDR